MTVEVKLFATLRKFLPPGGDGKSAAVELTDGATVNQLLRKLKIPAADAQLVLIDGQHTHDRDQSLPAGCTVSVFPALAGGSETSPRD